MSYGFPKRQQPRADPPDIPFEAPRAYGRKFIKYHLAPKDPSLKRILDEDNRRPLRSFWGDLVTVILQPVLTWLTFYYVYYSALWDDIMYTWDWGPYKGYDEDFSNAQYRRYTKGFDMPTRQVYDWPNQPHTYDY